MGCCPYLRNRRFYLAVILIFLRKADCTYFHISGTGTDVDDCGFNETHPCASLSGLEGHGLGPDDIVTIDSTAPLKDHCMTTPWKTSLNITGINGKPRIICSKAGGNVLHIESHGLEKSHVELRNVIFEKGNIYMSMYNMLVKISNCDFRKVAFVIDKYPPADFFKMYSNLSNRTTSLGVRKRNNEVDVLIENSTWPVMDEAEDLSSLNRTMQLIYDIYIRGNTIKVNLIESEFMSRRIYIDVGMEINLTATKTHFKGKYKNETKIGGIHVAGQSFGGKGSISISDCTFSNLKPQSYLLRNLYREREHVAALYITFKGIDIFIDNCLFHGNLGAIDLLTPFDKAIIISKSTFVENVRLDNGGALNFREPVGYALSHNGIIILMNSTFTNNVAGNFDANNGFQTGTGKFPDGIVEYSTAGTFIHTYKKSGFREQQMFGDGGALYMENFNSAFFIENCNFINNSASNLGGSVFLLNVKGTYVKNSIFSISEAMPNQASEILYGENGAIVMHDVYFDVIKMSEESNRAFTFTGNKKGMIETFDVRLRCPFGRYSTCFSQKPQSKAEVLRHNLTFNRVDIRCKKCLSRYSNERDVILFSSPSDMSSIAGPHTQACFLKATSRFLLKSGDISKITCHYENLNGANNWMRVRRCTDDFQDEIWSYCDKKPGPVYPPYPTYSPINPVLPPFPLHDDRDTQVPLLAHQNVGLKTQLKSSIPSYQEGNISSLGNVCQECPYGGKCTQNVVAKPNYWGINIGNQSQSYHYFYRCPPSYCCSKKVCDSYYECNNNRTGTLCGSCKMGFTKSLFTSGCVKEQGCGNYWFFLVAGTALFLYATFLMFQGDFVAFIFSHATDFGLQCRKSRTGTGKDQVKQSSGIGGVFILLFSYFQDASLMQVPITYSKLPKVINTLSHVVSGVMKFRLNFFDIAFPNLCLFPGMTTIHALLLRASFVPALLWMIVMYHLIGRCLQMKGKQNAHPLLTRSLKAMMLALMFCYQKLSSTSFTLLKCNFVFDANVLYVDGSITCYNSWQYVLMFYVAICILPFWIHLAIGPFLLKKKFIRYGEYCCSSVLPLPFVLSWPFRFWKSPTHDAEDKSGSKALGESLQGPYKELFIPFTNISICWSGIVILRRLLLILASTFSDKPFPKLLLMLCTTFSFLLLLLLIKPYKNGLGQMAGTIESVALNTVCVINLLKASFEAAEYNPLNYVYDTMVVANEVENILMAWLPLIGAGVIALLLIKRLLLAICNLLLSVINKCSKMRKIIVTVRPQV